MALPERAPVNVVAAMLETPLIFVTASPVKVAEVAATTPVDPFRDTPHVPAVFELAATQAVPLKYMAAFPVAVEGTTP